MPRYDFQCLAFFQHLEPGLMLGETLFFPETSVLGQKPDHLEKVLEEHTSELLRETPIEAVYRHQAPESVLPISIPIELTPPERALDWTSPIKLTFHGLRWQHGETHHIAYFPSLGVEVIASSLETLEARLLRELEAALARDNARGNLRELVWLQRCRSLETVPLLAAAEVLSPREAARKFQQADESPSILSKVARRLDVRAMPRAWEVEGVVSRLADALSGQPPRSVLLVGPSGVGKSAIFYELVRRRSHLGLGGKPFYATSGARLVAGASGFGMWQERCLQLCREVSAKQAVLHLGNLFELLEVGKGEGQPQGIASFLRPHIARGELLAVAEVTPETLARIEARDPHLINAFVKLELEEPSEEICRAILLNVALDFKPHRREPAYTCDHSEKSELAVADVRPLRQPDPLPHLRLAGETTSSDESVLDVETIEAIDRLHRRYATYSALPGRPVRFLETVLEDLPAGEPLTGSRVLRAFSQTTGLPLFLLDETLPLDLDKTRSWFSQRIIGQPEALELVVDLLAMVKAGLNPPGRPIASLLFIGPTGVGKTQLARSLAEFFFQSADRITRFDMSEYADAMGIDRLIGETSGGVGLLTDRVRQFPFSVVLLDEFEKAHPRFFDLLLQVLGEGRLTDAAGRLADFRNTVVIMTSNLGAESYHPVSTGFGLETSRNRRALDHFLGEVKRFVRPELFNRIDRVVPFAPLAQESVLAITRRGLELIRARDGIRHRGVYLDVDDAVCEHLARKGYDVRYGARPLKRMIEAELLAPLADRLNRYPSDFLLDANVWLENDRLKIKVRPSDSSANNEVRHARIGSKSSAYCRSGIDSGSGSDGTVEDVTFPCGTRDSGSSSVPLELVERCVALRREMQALERGGAYLARKNEAARLLRGARSYSQRQWKSEAQLQQMARLERLTVASQAFERLYERVCGLEDRAVLAFTLGSESIETAAGSRDDTASKQRGESWPVAEHKGESDELARAIEQASSAWQDQLLSLMDLELDTPGQVVLGIYATSIVVLLSFCRGYCACLQTLGYQVRLWEVAKKPEKEDKRSPEPVPKCDPKRDQGSDSKRESKSDPKRESKHEQKRDPRHGLRHDPRRDSSRDPKHDPDLDSTSDGDTRLSGAWAIAFQLNPVETLTQYMEKLSETPYGMVLEIRGRHARSRWGLEEGAHFVLEKGKREGCLVHVGTDVVESYLPPPGIERKNFLEKRAARRKYDVLRGTVEDSLVSRPLIWNGRDLEEPIRILNERALQEKARELLEL